MNDKQEIDIMALLLDAYNKSFEVANEVAWRTKTPLVIEVNGKIKKIKPKCPYAKSKRKTKN